MSPQSRRSSTPCCDPTRIGCAVCEREARREEEARGQSLAGRGGLWPLLLLSGLLVAGTTARAEPPSKRPTVFVWKIDNANGAPIPVGSGFLLGPRGDVLTARHVAESSNPYQRLQISIGSKEVGSVPLAAPPVCDPVLDPRFLKLLETTVATFAIAPWRLLPTALPAPRWPGSASGLRLSVGEGRALDDRREGDNDLDRRRPGAHRPRPRAYDERRPGLRCGRRGG